MQYKRIMVLVNVEGKEISTPVELNMDSLKKADKQINEVLRYLPVTQKIIISRVDVPDLEVAVEMPKV